MCYIQYNGIWGESVTELATTYCNDVNMQIIPTCQSDVYCYQGQQFKCVSAVHTDIEAVNMNG
jgi:hypothetical protein